MGKKSLIQVAKRELCLEEDVYRSILVRLTGKNSLRAMTPRQLDIIIDGMKKLGFKVKPKNGQTDKLRPQLELIRSLWAKLAKNGTVRNGSEMALNQFVKRMVKVDTIQWLNERKASQVIEHLKHWLSRTEAKNEQ